MSLNSQNLKNLGNIIRLYILLLQVICLESYYFMIMIQVIKRRYSNLSTSFMLDNRLLSYTYIGVKVEDRLIFFIRFTIFTILIFQIEKTI